MKIKVSREAKVGLFGICMLFVLYWGINFLKGVEVLSARNTFYAEYPKSDNIEVSSPVLLRGIKIGTVTDISLSEDNTTVILTMTVDGKYSLPNDSRAVITNKSMLGGKAVAIELGKSSEYLNDKQYIVGEIDNNMQEQIDVVKDKLMHTVAELTSTLEGINAILNDTTVSNINQTIANVSAMTDAARITIDHSSKNIESIVSDLSAVTSSFKEETPAILGSMRNLTDSLDAAAIAATLRSAQSTMEELDQTIAAINSRQGTIGKLIYDPAMYDNLNGAADSLKALFGNIKEQPGRYVHFSVFGKKDK